MVLLFVYKLGMVLLLCSNRKFLLCNSLRGMGYVRVMNDVKNEGVGEYVNLRIVEI